MNEFNSIFAERLAEYVQLQRHLGLRFYHQNWTLRTFDRWLCKTEHDGELSQHLALAFASSPPSLSATERARRYHDVRRFSEYLAVHDPNTPRLDPRALPQKIPRPPAHIYSDAELEQLLHGARRISSHNPIRGVTLHAIVGLGASAGLRIGEVVRLDKTDVDLKTGLLTIRRSKFGKDRWVPVHATTLDVLRDYADMRDAFFVGCQCSAFFISMRGWRFVENTLQTAFRHLAQRVGLRGSKGPGPSYHDLRHSFIVRRLVAWYEAGLDVQSRLPALATYVGHVHYSDTAYYITATAELMEQAACRYYPHLGPSEVSQ
jgi:integrase